MIFHQLPFVLQGRGGVVGPIGIIGPGGRAVCTASSTAAFFSVILHQFIGCVLLFTGSQRRQGQSWRDCEFSCPLGSIICSSTVCFCCLFFLLKMCSWFLLAGITRTKGMFSLFTIHPFVFH